MITFVNNYRLLYHTHSLASPYLKGDRISQVIGKYAIAPHSNL
ncbi:MAG TPA: hypothetical protein V6D09_04955 [Leptolyngbyaceae cyanobacterium]